ncbi:MAG TPA: CAP domain-containing protein [Solirubrobacteraceae bacterium]|nr:CAP domain-containing protein [Solirubrobacteraceae bacterium]
MLTSRQLRAAALLAGLLCVLVPASALAETHAGTHTRTDAHRARAGKARAGKARTHRACARTRAHGRVLRHGAGVTRGARAHAHGAGRAHACSRRSRRAPGHRGRHRHGNGHRHDSSAPRRHVSQLPSAPPPATGSGCQGTTLIPDEANLPLVREATLCLVNRERTRAGEQPLREDAALAAAAQGHSTSMAVHGYFEHVSPGGSTPLSRIRESGYLSRSTPGYIVGENIAWGSYTDATPAAIVAGWMASPPHRANILDRSFRDSGMGVSPHLPPSFAAGAAGAIYTQDFGVVVG